MMGMITMITLLLVFVYSKAWENIWRKKSIHNYSKINYDLQCMLAAEHNISWVTLCEWEKESVLQGEYNFLSSMCIQKEHSE